LTLVNQAVADVYGTSIEQLIGKSDADFNSNEAEVEFFRRIDRQVLESGRPLLIPEERITDASGAVRWLQTVRCPIIGDSGRAEQVLGISTDITERKRIAVALRAEGVRVRAMQRVTAGLAAAASPVDVAHVVATGEPIFITSRAEYEARFPALRETLASNPNLASRCCR
jgi:PAS domain S-box-containing protein